MKKILIVDNHPVMLKLIANLLEKEGHEVLTANGGLVALDILGSCKPDFIFVDLVMPNIDGKKLCKIIRGIEKLKDVYIVIASAIMAEERIDISELGVNACIVKGPFKEMSKNILAIIHEPEQIALRCAKGEILGFETVYPREVTEELLSVKRDLEIFLERTSEGILEITTDGRIVYANPTALSLIRRPEEKVLSTNFTELFSGEDRRRIVELLSRTGKEPKKIGANFPVTLNACQVTVNVLSVEDGEYKSIIILNDITEHKRIEENLKETNKFLKNLLDSSSSISIISTDLHQNVLFWNKGAEEIFGYKAEEIIDKKKIDILYPDEETKKLAGNIRSSIFNAKNGINCELKEITRDGRELWMSLNLTPRLDETGQVIGIMGIGEDITERKQAEIALRESEEKYKNIVENTLDVIMLTQPDGIISYLSPACRHVLGYDSEDLINRRPWIIHDDDLDRVKEIHYSALKGESRTNFEYRIVTKRGDVKWVSHSWSPIMADEKLQVIVSVVRDITERKQAEMALQQSEERYRSLVENTLDGYFICETSSGRFLFLNHRICDLFGYTMKEGLERTVWDVIYHEEHLRIQERIRERLEGKQVSSERQIYRAVRRDGSIFRVEVSTSIVTFQGNPAFQGVLRDVTEQQRLQIQLQQAQKMEAIGTLAGGVAHDFNNLLMGIQGRTSLMLLETNASHSHYEHLKGIEEYVRSAANLTIQLLGFAKGGKYEVKPTNLNEIIKQSSEMFGRTKKEIVIHTKYQKDIWAVDVDQGQIEQVLLNLYVNAWQAMPAGGGLILETQNIVLDAFDIRPYDIDPGKYVKISVIDSGAGMDEATQQRIFDPFFTTKEMGRGTGLGLASVYGIIKNHGGVINVQSKKGEGTTFTILLPASGKMIGEEKSLFEEMLKGSEIVLLVDDEEMILNVGKQMMESLGYSVLLAKGGTEALRIYEENQKGIDMVILDMIMPDMDGGQAYDKLREINPEIKVLLSSGYNIDGKARTILDRGCNGFIQKPFNIEVLSQKLRSILAH